MGTVADIVAPAAAVGVPAGIGAGLSAMTEYAGTLHAGPSNSFKAWRAFTAIRGGAGAAGGATAYLGARYLGEDGRGVLAGAAAGAVVAGLADFALIPCRSIRGSAVSAAWGLAFGLIGGVAGAGAAKEASRH